MNDRAGSLGLKPDCVGFPDNDINSPRTMRLTGAWA